MKKERQYKGIKKAAGNTQGLGGYYGDLTAWIIYNKKTDTVTSWRELRGIEIVSEYHDPDEIRIATDTRMTMEKIKERIEEKEQFLEAEEAYWERRAAEANV